MNARALLAGIALLCAAAAAQDGERLVVDGPTPKLVPLGSSCDVSIAIVGENAKPRSFQVPAVDGVRVEVQGPSSQTYTSIVNGRMQRDVRVTFALTIVPSRIGHFRIPPFKVHTGTREQTVPAIEFDCERDLKAADRAFVTLTAEPTRVYQGEPVRFTFDYGIDARLAPLQATARNGQEYNDIEITAPWFADPKGAVPVEGSDDEQEGTKVNLVFNDHLQVAGYEKNATRGTGTYHRFTVTKSFLPTAPGELVIDAPVLRSQVSIGAVRRDFFGAISGRTETIHAYGEPVRVLVLPIPTEGRPADYTNAIGRFTLAASAEPRRVRAGDSVKLTLAITGHGNTEFLDPPAFPKSDAFHLLGTNIKRARDRVEVTYDLTPLRTDVTQLPALGWSFFDTTPGVEKFVTVRTDAIPITVDPPAEGERLSVLPGENDAAVVAGVDDIFDMKALGAGEPAPLEPSTGRGVAAALVLAPWCVALALALLWRAHGRRRADVRGRRAARAQKRFRALLAAGDPLPALTAYVADRLGVADAAVIGPDLAERLCAAGLDAELAAEVHAAIDAGTAARYGGGATLDAATARALVERLEPQRLAPPRAVGAALALLLALAGTAVAQADPRIAAAEAAYRRGDYAAAAEGFAAAAAAPGADRRLCYDLGNSLYRQTRFAEALVAYERARLALPRDAELLANIALVRKKLDLASGEGEPFTAALTALRDRFTACERLWLAIAANALAALGIVFGRRALRWLGVALAVPALAFAVEAVVLGPARPPRAIVLAPRVDVVAEPRAGLEPVLKLRQGVAVELIAESDAWASVRVDGRRGYVPADSIGVVR